MKPWLIVLGLVVILAASVPGNAQISFSWEIISATQDSIYAHVHAINTGGTETLPIIVANWPWLELFVDGEWDMNAPSVTGGYVSNSLFIWEYYDFYISYNPDSPIPMGEHTVDVRKYQDPYVYDPFLAPATIYISETFEYIEFYPQVEVANQDRIYVSLTLYNPGPTSCTIDYPDNQWIQTYLDGVQIIPTYQSNPAWMIIPSGTTYSALILYNPIESIPFGTHSLQFHISDHGWVPPLVINIIGPSGADDDVNASNASFLAYPNPFRERASIEIQSAQSDDTQLSIYNQKGQLVRCLSRPDTSDLHVRKYQWDGRDGNHQDLANGIYFIKYKAKGKDQAMRLLKVK